VSFLSSDHGATWRSTGSVPAIRYTMIDSATPAIAMAGSGTSVLAATWGRGIMRREGSGWVPSGLEKRQVWDIVVKEY
jgi:hypothetical protein